MSALFAHPAAAVPLKRYGLSLSALIVGSMSPDFFYFVHLSTNSQFGHTLPGVFLFCLPTGLAVLWIFHMVVKCPLFSLLPGNHQTRVCPVIQSVTCFSSGTGLLLIMVSLLVGAWTHILWDSCTHVSGWTVHHVAFLRFPLLITSQGTLRVYKVLQHGGTIGGTLLLIGWYWRWCAQAPAHLVPAVFYVPKVTKILIVCALVGFASLLGIGYGVSKGPTIHDVDSFSYCVIFSVKAGLASGCLGMLAFSIGWHAVRRSGHGVCL